MRLRPDDLARLFGGRLEGEADGTGPLRGITTDSRQVVPGGCFVAVRGEREDGHAYAGDAAARGAALAIVDSRQLDAAPPLLLRVGDTAAALRRACTARLEELGCTVVGITGSVGKTTAKELVAHVLTGSVAVARTPGNLNTWTGVPCSVLAEDGPVDVFVVEMAMSARGEIRDLATFTRPRIGVLLNVGVSHIELLGSREAIADAKGELLESLPADGLAVLNADDERVRALAARTPAPVRWFGLGEDADYAARDIVPDGLRGVRFQLVAPGGAVPVRLSVPGVHLVTTACAAAAVADHLGVPVARAAERLATFSAPEQRGTVRAGRQGSTIYDDSYNSAPASLAAALDVLAWSGTDERVAVIGDMLELGDEAAAAHAEAGRQAALAATTLVAVGANAPRVVAAAIDSGLDPDRTWVVRDADEAVDVVVPLLAPNATVLVKGSHGLHLERIVERLVEDAG